MKKITKLYMCLLGGMFLGAGCNDFLKEDSGDLLIPGKVEEYAPMLYKEGYPMDFYNEVAWFNLMTDDVEMGHLELDPEDEEYENWEKSTKNFSDFTTMVDGGEVYQWKDRFDGHSDRFWESRYQNILACNTVIDALPQMEYVKADSGKYHFLASQAYALRAYYYWCLVNTYALPWTAGNLEKPGVVVRTQPQIDISARRRSTIGEVYRLINEDIAEAEKHGNVAAFDGNIHRISPTAVLLLASRIALFQENWDEVIRTGELFLEKNPAVLDLNAQKAEALGEDSDEKGFAIMSRGNKEVVFTFGGKTSTYHYGNLSNSAYWGGLGFRTSHSVEGALTEAYEEGDLRKKAYFKQDIPAKEGENWWDPSTPYTYKYYYPVKYRGIPRDGAEKPAEKLLHENWRSVEVLLNVAEAYTRKYNAVTNEALSLLNRLLRCRWEKSVFVEKTAADFGSGDALVKFIWEERRRELCFEEAMRFWDLKRQGMPELKHRWYSSWDAFETYTLKEGSPNYVLPIPRSELDYNGGCTDNARELILPE